MPAPSCPPPCTCYTCRELAGIAATEAQAQLVNLDMLRLGDVRRNRHANASVRDQAAYLGEAAESLVALYAFSAVPFGSDAPVRRALVDTLRQQVQVKGAGTGGCCQAAMHQTAGPVCMAQQRQALEAHCHAALPFHMTGTSPPYGPQHAAIHPLSNPPLACLLLRRTCITPLGWPSSAATLRCTMRGTHRSSRRRWWPAGY